MSVTLVMSRIMQYFNLHAKRSELKPFLEDMARAEGYKLGDAPDPEDKSDTVKALAVAAAALYGGYKLGKAMLPDVKKLFK